MAWIDEGNGLQFEGEWPPGFRLRLDKLLNQLQGTGRNGPERVCSELNDAVENRFVSKETIWRLSKWCDWSSEEAQAIARDIGNHLFGRYPQPRLWDEHNKPKPDRQTAEARYAEWVKSVVGGSPPVSKGKQEQNMAHDLLDLLTCFRQVIIYGPPGTGKTRLARQIALKMLNRETPPEQTRDIGEQTEPPSPERDADAERKLDAFRRENRFDLVVFHPSYEYEQFIGGIEPVITGGILCFQAKTGPLLRLCRAAEQHPGNPVILLIDEINRGNLPKLLGELVYALEYRGSSVTLPFTFENRSDLVIPDNLYVIGTMNSADRSIGHIDVAIRRRFALYHLPPSSEVVKNEWKNAGDADYGEQLAQLMERVNSDLGQEGEWDAELGVGQSYFIPTPPLSSLEENKRQVEMKWENQVRPLLREYAQLLNLGPEFLGRFPETLGEALASG
ncbi:MAG: AAA family ATPase [Planctomycetes bacterium]|nr:AAA family ATPase [Planctomycetota bacterium]